MLPWPTWIATCVAPPIRSKVNFSCPGLRCGRGSGLGRICRTGNSWWCCYCCILILQLEKRFFTNFIAIFIYQTYLRNHCSVIVMLATYMVFLLHRPWLIMYMINKCHLTSFYLGMNEQWFVCLFMELYIQLVSPPTTVASALVTQPVYLNVLPA